MTKNKRGGRRHGAGRPKLKDSEKKEATKVMRVPHSKVDDVKKYIQEGCAHNVVRDGKCFVCGKEINLYDIL